MWMEVPSPIGPIRLTEAGNALTGVFMLKHKHGPAGFSPEERGDSPLLEEAARQLAAYFDGTLTKFDLPLVPEGSDFQRQVWDELRRIPFGETTSYMELAKRIGDTRHVRAVGAANGRNPISIIIPCHRVVGSDGSLVGYGGGLERKRWLLDHEIRVTGVLLQ
jgi:methylated-DNA-[protein]-cysteine S-methyltransferase